MWNRVVHLVLSFLIVSSAPRAEDHLQFGRPACTAPLLDKKFFIICHDGSRKIPAWVAHSLTKEDALNKTTARRGSFKADPALPAGQRAENADYAKSGYDKGHMAPANDFTRSIEAMESTFVLTNAVPQRHGVNGGKWAQLEQEVHDLAVTHGTTWVFTGPVFAGKSALRTIGANKVAVPTHTYKVVLCVHPDGVREMYAFVLPNIEKPSGTLSGYTFSVRKVEELTGLNFFDGLDASEQDRLEVTVRDLPK